MTGGEERTVGGEVVDSGRVGAPAQQAQAKKEEVKMSELDIIIMKENLVSYSIMHNFHGIHVHVCT